LIYSKVYTDPDEAMEFYGKARTYNGKGVTIASQRRYIKYYAEILNKGLKYTPVPLNITSIKLLPGPKKGNDIYFVVSTHQKVIYTSDPVKLNKNGELELSLDDCVASGDTKIEFWMHMGVSGKKKSVCHIWFNTFFIENHNQLVLHREEIDKTNKDKKFKIFSSDFHIEVNFSDAERRSTVDRHSESASMSSAIDDLGTQKLNEKN